MAARRLTDATGRLYAAYHEINERSFAGLLPVLPIFVQASVRPSRRDAKTEVYAFLWQDDFTGAPRHIVFKEAYLIDPVNSWTHVRETLIHEMIHVWQAVRGEPVNHGPAFRRMAKRLSISERAVD